MVVLSSVTPPTSCLQPSSSHQPPGSAGSSPATAAVVAFCSVRASLRAPRIDVPAGQGEYLEYIDLQGQRADKLQSRSPLTVDVPESSRRHAILCSGASLVCFLTANCVKAEEKSLTETEDEGGNGVLESIKSLFDPNEKTNSGKILPKAYLQSAREVVKTLRDSLGEDADDIAKFRRTADAAKESIRNYLNGWRGQKAVVAEVYIFP